MWTIVLYLVYVLIALGVIVYVFGKSMHEKECEEAEQRRAGAREAREWLGKMRGDSSERPDVEDRK